MGVSQLSGTGPEKKHIFQCPAQQGDQTAPGQGTLRVPGRGAVVAVLEMLLEMPICGCCAAFSFLS